jgi:hypothetical protein
MVLKRSNDIMWEPDRNTLESFRFSLKFGKSLGLYGNCFVWSFHQQTRMNGGEFSRKDWQEGSKNLDLVAGLIVSAVNSLQYFLKDLIWNWAWSNLMHLQQNIPMKKFWVKLILKIIACHRAKIGFPEVSNGCDNSVKADGVLIIQNFLQNAMWIVIFYLRIRI